MDIVCWSSEPISLDKILLDDSHPKIRTYFNEIKMSRQRLSENSPAPSNKQQKTVEWAKKHLERCEEKGLDFTSYGGPPIELYKSFPGLHKLTERQIDALVVSGVKFPEKRPRTVDLSQQLDRQSLKDGQGCVKPTMCSYVTSKCRTTVGAESLFLQGIHYGPNNHKIMNYPDSLLADLGGNAFEASRPFPVSHHSTPHTPYIIYIYIYIYI